MNEQEIKTNYDVGFVSPLVEMGLISENFEKTAEEKGRAIDVLESLIKIGSEESSLLKISYEFGQRQAAIDLGLLSKKDDEALLKTAAEQGLATDLKVIEGIRNFFLQKLAEADDVPPVSNEHEIMRALGKGALTTGQAGVQAGRGYLGGSILGGLAGAGLGAGALGGAGYGAAHALGASPTGKLLATLGPGALGLLGGGAWGAELGGLLGGLQGAERGLGTVQRAMEGPQIDPRILQGM